MSIEQYEREVNEGLKQALRTLKRIDGFVLYSLNIWTDPAAGVTSFSADTRENSGRFVKDQMTWQAEEAKRLRSLGDHELADLIDRPRSRTDNPADFEYRDIVRIEHVDWHKVVADAKDIWDAVEMVLSRTRNNAANMIPRILSTEPDAEVSIGTRRDWYDNSVPIVQKNEE